MPNAVDVKLCWPKTNFTAALAVSARTKLACKGQSINQAHERMPEPHGHCCTTLLAADQHPSAHLQVRWSCMRPERLDDTTSLRASGECDLMPRNTRNLIGLCADVDVGAGLFNEKSQELCRSGLFQIGAGSHWHLHGAGSALSRTFALPFSMRSVVSINITATNMFERFRMIINPCTAIRMYLLQCKNARCGNDCTSRVVATTRGTTPPSHLMLASTRPPFSGMV